MKLGLIVFSLLVGCGGANALDKPAYNAGDYLAAGAANALDSATTKKQLADVISGAMTSGRDALLDDKTKAWALDLETSLLREFRNELRLAILQSKEDVLQNLDVDVRRIVEAAISGTSTKPSLGAFGKVREELLGAPLRGDLKLALTDLDPQLQDMIKRASSNAAAGASVVVASDVADIDRNIEKWKWIAITLAFAVGILVFMHAHAVHAMTKRND